MLHPRRLLALVCGLFAVFALVLGAWSAAEFRAATLERPWFVAPMALAVAEDGTLYVAASGSEVQVYGPDGTPVRAWRLARGGPLRLQLEADRLSVAYADSDRVDLFARDGTPLGERSDRGAYARFARSGEDGAASGEAQVTLRPEGIVRTAPPPARVLVPLPPRPLSFFGERPLLPITGTLLAALAGLVAGLALALRAPAARG